MSTQTPGEKNLLAGMGFEQIFPLFPEDYHTILIVISFCFFGLPLIVLGLVLLVDFFSLGRLKRIEKKWFSGPYVYLHKLLGYLTLSFIHRPLYYTLLEDVPRKTIGIIFFAYFILLFG